MVRKENFQYVEKVWGEEIILVNCEYYCGKFLVLDARAETSYHRHIKKQETFYCLEGYCFLEVDGKRYLMSGFTRPKTILAGTLHKLIGTEEPCVVLEISMPHSDEDVERLSCSKASAVLLQVEQDLLVEKS